jgi:DNA-binding NarL/FixJ family response regulator
VLGTLWNTGRGVEINAAPHCGRERQTHLEEGDCGVSMKVLIADDHGLFREGIRQALEAVEGIEVVAEASSGAEVVPLIGRFGPDVVILDLRMPKLDGLGCLERIRKLHPKLKVVILSAFSDPDHIQAAFRRGANAYIVKSVDPLDLPAALRQVLETTIYFPASFRPSEEDGPLSTLTARELSMLKALARGLSNQAIGREFWVTEQTVKFHLTNIYRKLGVRNRTEATRFAYEHGLADELAAAA